MGLAVAEGEGGGTPLCLIALRGRFFSQAMRLLAGRIVYPASGQCAPPAQRHCDNFAQIFMRRRLWPLRGVDDRAYLSSSRGCVCAIVLPAGDTASLAPWRVAASRCIEGGRWSGEGLVVCACAPPASGPSTCDHVQWRGVRQGVRNVRALVWCRVARLRRVVVGGSRLRWLAGTSGPKLSGWPKQHGPCCCCG